MMAGFRRPHRDFLVHQQYWDQYPDASEIATAKVRQTLCSFRRSSFSSFAVIPLAAFDPRTWNIVLTLTLTLTLALKLTLTLMLMLQHPVRSPTQPLIAFHPGGFILPNGTSYP